MPTNVLLQSISELEASFQMPKEFSNEIKIKDGDKGVVYVARAYNLWLDGLNIRGNLSLTKFEIQTRWRTRIESLIPLRFATLPREKRKQIWQFVDDSDGNFKFLISDGEPARNKTCKADCETALLGRAAGSRVILSDKLLNSVLLSIYKDLMKTYRTVRYFGGKQS